MSLEIQIITNYTIFFDHQKSPAVGNQSVFLHEHQYAKQHEGGCARVPRNAKGVLRKCLTTRSLPAQNPCTRRKLRGYSATIFRSFPLTEMAQTSRTISTYSRQLLSHVLDFCKL